MNLQAKILLIDHNILKIAPIFLKSVFYMVSIFIFISESKIYLQYYK